MRRLLSTLVLLVGVTTCGGKEELVMTSGALTVHITECVGPTPNVYGTVDAFALPGYNASAGCIRVHGAVNRGSDSVGYIFTPPWPVRSLKLSNTNTVVSACSTVAQGPSYFPCAPGQLKVFSTTNGLLSVPYIYPGGAPSIVVGFSALLPPPLCPYVTGPFAHPSFCDVCGTYSDSAMPVRVCHGVADPGSPIVGDIHSGAACTCPADSVVTVDSECRATCN